MVVAHQEPWTRQPGVQATPRPPCDTPSRGCATPPCGCAPVAHDGHHPSRYGTATAAAAVLPLLLNGGEQCVRRAMHLVWMSPCAAD
eukprot:275344-Prymnesium_polylepis.1